MLLPTAEEEGCAAFADSLLSSEITAFVSSAGLSAEMTFRLLFLFMLE